MNDPAPLTLWRHARLNAQIGLFKVADGIHQLRGFDLANMTLVDGNTGAVFTSVTTTVKLFVCCNTGDPSSYTRTVIVFVLGACAGVGVQLNTPLVVMPAPAGAPAPRVKVTDWGG